MNTEISFDDIVSFQKEYKSCVYNGLVEDRIKSLGIKKASVDEFVKSEFKFNFNVEVPKRKIYNQKNSFQCNIYAFLRVVSDIVRSDSDLDVDNIDFSSNYINFYDKFEKVNVVYNKLLEIKDLSVEKINDTVDSFIGSFGTFHFCREIVNKYGLVPVDSMNEVNDNYDDFLTNELLKAKVKVDCLKLLKNDVKDRKKFKRDFMCSIYDFLSKVYGNPPTEFIYQDKKITPLEFKNKYLGSSLDDYITVTSFDLSNLFSSQSFIPNIYLHNSEKILRVSVDKMKQAVLNQLKEGISVWFSSEESTTLDYDFNILDDSLYNYHNLLGISEVSKKDRLLLNLINYDHAMSITGALVENNQVKQFKVDNSFGKHGEYNGQLIMTNSFFENCVITVILNKKYVNN